MQQVKFTTQMSSYQATRTSKSVDSAQSDFAEMIQGSKQNVQSNKDASKEEKQSISSKDAKEPEKVEVETDEKEVQPKEELSAEWMLQMQAMGLQVVQPEAELPEDVAEVLTEVPAVDASTEIPVQAAEQMSTETEQVLETVMPQEEASLFTQENLLSQENVSLEALSTQETSLEESVFTPISDDVKQLPEQDIVLDDVAQEPDAEVKEVVTDIDHAVQSEEVSTAQLEIASDTSADADSKEELGNEIFHEEISMQQMQGRNLRMQTSFSEKMEVPTILRTTPQNLPEDLGTTLAARFPEQDGVLTIELEPATLGKLTIQVVYEEGRTAVSIFASNPKTLEMLSQNAGEIAQILEDKTGQEVAIYTPETEQEWQEQSNQQERRNSREQEPQEHKKQQEPDSFAQQLRLGLV